jgi:hypothetical protein
MSRIKAPPQPEETWAETCENYYNEDPEGAVPSLYGIVAYGVVINLIIILIQYCVLRCSNAVKKENIFNFLLVGTLITIFISVASITLFFDETLVLLEDSLDRI